MQFPVQRSGRQFQVSAGVPVQARMPPRKPARRRLRDTSCAQVSREGSVGREYRNKRYERRRAPAG